MGATIFGNDDHVEIMALNNSDRFSSLQSGLVDVLAAGATYTMERDVLEVRASVH